MSEFEVISEVRAELGEGPAWDDRNHVLYWVDILGHKIYTYDPASGETKSYDQEHYVGAVVPTQSGRLAVAGYTSMYMFDPATSAVSPLASPPVQDDDLRFNDGKCDPAGRFWAGTTSLSGRQGESALYRLDADGSFHTMLTGVSISNGLGWSPDGKTMYYIDTPTATVVAFDFDMETGSISNKRVVIEVPESEGFPDGMTVDEEGKLWIAHWGGSQVACWDPASGRKLTSIALPAPHTTSCVFGGAERNVLYVTSARTGLSEEQLKQYPLSGAVFKIQMQTRGAVTYRYRDE